MGVETAKALLEGDGATGGATLKSSEGVSEEEIAALVRNVVVEVTPSAGSYYIQGENNVITLYYY